MVLVLQAPAYEGVNSALCHQPDHMVAYNCGDFRRLVEESGWRCKTAFEELKDLGETRSSLTFKYGLRSAGNSQFVCQRRRI